MLGEEVYCPPISPQEIKAQREKRVAAMWQRFLRLMESEGRPVDHYLPVHGVESRRLHMRSAVRRGMPEGWFFASGLEAADLGIDEPSAIEMGEPTSAFPGTREKLEVLADRAATGVALWHPEDGALAED